MTTDRNDQRRPTPASVTIGKGGHEHLVPVTPSARRTFASVQEDRSDIDQETPLAMVLEVGD